MALDDHGRDARPTPPDDGAPGGFARDAFDVWRGMLESPSDVLDAQVEFASRWTQIVAGTFGTMTGAQAPAAVIEPEKGDKRWKHPAWSQNAMLDALKQGYLLATRSMLESIDAADGVDAQTKARVKFFAKQFCDAMSPSNSAVFNPAVVEETLRTGGENLRKGALAMLEDAKNNNGRPSLVDKNAFTVGKNVATTQGSVVFRNELIELIQYAPTTERIYERPLVIVPPWINKYYILDLQPANSFVKYATDNGIATFVVSWRNPNGADAALTFEDYMRLGPLAANGAAREILGSDDVNQIGYCIGGTLTAMQLAYQAKTDPGAVRSATFFAALTDFADVGDIANFMSPETRAFLDRDMDKHGVLTPDKMADAFRMIRANDLIWNVAVDRYLLGKPAPAFDLLYWNEDATAMPAAMHRYYLENMYVRNALSRGELTLAGERLELPAIQNDVYAVASVDDHIAPWRSVYRMVETFGGDVRFRLGHSGHIAGIVNPPGAQKGEYRRNDAAGKGTPAEQWLAGAERVAGSWWPDWFAWIEERSGERIPAPASVGSDRHPPLEPAPGSYVFT